MKKFKLTVRQVEILKLATMSNPEIAKELSISMGTVRTHLSDIYRALGVSSRAGAIVHCLKMGWISLDEVKSEVD